MLIGPTKAAELAGTTRQRIYMAIKRGELRTLPDVPVVLLDRDEVAAWAERPASKGGRPKKATKEGS